MDNRFNKAAIGIDLGTTYSAIGHIARTGRVELIPNFFTDLNTTPSIVLFDSPSEPIEVGQTVKSSAAFYPGQFVECAKRLMANPRGKPWEAQLQAYSPEDVSAIILRYLKGLAERRLGIEVGCTVITVPAWFSDDARQATLRAGVRAGLDVVGILSEPSAAAIAWAVSNIQQSGLQAVAGKTILVYDLGGGTFDVSIVKVLQDGVIQELRRNGDVNLGGKDWDTWISDTVLSAFEIEHGFQIPKGHSDCCDLLINEAEKAKHRLSQSDYAKLVITHNLKRTQTKVFREDFLEGTKSLLARTLAITKDTLGDARLRASDIDVCLPVGGSTRMPQVKQLLENLFGPNKVDHSIKQDEVVAQGATLFMARKLLLACDGNVPAGDKTNLSLLDTRTRELLEKLQILEVSPRSYGISGFVNSKKTIAHFVRRNESLPYTFSVVYSTVKDQQEHVDFGIFEGDSTNPMDCKPIGKRRIELSQPTARNTRLEFEIHIATENLITVKMRDPHTRKWQVLNHVLDDNTLNSNGDQELMARVDFAFQ